MNLEQRVARLEEAVFGGGPEPSGPEPADKVLVGDVPVPITSVGLTDELSDVSRRGFTTTLLDVFFAPSGGAGAEAAYRSQFFGLVRKEAQRRGLLYISFPAPSEALFLKAIEARIASKPDLILLVHRPTGSTWINGQPYWGAVIGPKSVV